MAEIYKSVPGRGGGKIEKVIAKNDGVQSSLDEHLFRAAVAAEVILEEIHMADPLVQHNASIDIEKANVDRYLILVDKATAPADLNPLVHNLNTAMAIEYGRAAGSREITVRDPDTGQFIQKTVKWGATEGSRVLQRALNVKLKRKGKVSV